MLDEWGLVMMGQNVENVNKAIGLCEVEVNGMPFPHKLNSHGAGFTPRPLQWGIIATWVVKPSSWTKLYSLIHLVV
jgi:hypothetical protein